MNKLAEKLDIMDKPPSGSRLVSVPCKYDPVKYDLCNFPLVADCYL